MASLPIPGTLWPIWLSVPGLSHKAASENEHLPCVLHYLLPSMLVTARVPFDSPYKSVHLCFELGEPCLHLEGY